MHAFVITMIPKQDDYSLLERKYALYLLMLLDHYPNTTKTELMRMDEGNEKTKFVRLTELIDAGLVEYVELNGRRTNRLQLSELGKELIPKIKKIGSVLRKCNKPEETA